MSADPESFLARWSRRKRAAERAKEPPAESIAPEIPASQSVKVAAEAAEAGPVSSPVLDPAAATELPLPPIESLDGLRSDYQAFFQQPVAEDIRHAALKKLFADPHFNQMDMLDVYVDDYTQFEPLPAAMKLRLPSARSFLLDSEQAALEQAEASSGVPGRTGETGVDAAGLDAGGPNSAGDSSVESPTAPTAAPDASPLSAPSEQGKSEDVASSSVPVGKPIARDSTSI